MASAINSLIDMLIKMIGNSTLSSTGINLKGQGSYRGGRIPIDSVFIFQQSLSDGTALFLQDAIDTFQEKLNFIRKLLIKKNSLGKKESVEDRLRN